MDRSIGERSGSKAEKKKKRSRSVRRKKGARDSSDDVSGIRIGDIPGVSKVTLSAVTQRIIGCVIGQHVTSENPWVYVRKEIVEDNIDLHEDSSEFLPIKQEIQTYPDKDLLIGYAHDQALPTEFYVCTTLPGKEVVEQIIERQRAELMVRLQHCVARPVGEWHSLGSVKVELPISV